eukprot:s660_g4.t1
MFLVPCRSLQARRADGTHALEQCEDCSGIESVKPGSQARIQKLRGQKPVHENSVVGRAMAMAAAPRRSETVACDAAEHQCVLGS